MAHVAKTKTRYDIVEAKSINELVKLVNLKTKNGWVACGSVTYILEPPNYHIGRIITMYPFCQAITKQTT